MQVNVNKAVKMFFSNSSFEMIYNEAVANALDADATKIIIKINLPSFEEIQNLSLEITDNGVGFDDIRFGKFSKLFDVEEQTHKGLGRLVYLCYFDKVLVSSIFDDGLKKRSFVFSDEFDGACEIFDNVERSPRSTTLKMMGFSGVKLHKKDFVQPSYVKKLLLEEFYMRLYRAKLLGKRIKIQIKSNICGSNVESTIDTANMQNLEVKHLEHQLDLLNSIDLYYSVRETNDSSLKPITAIAVDDRCHKIDIIDDEDLPVGYEMIFLLMSKSFDGAINESRQNLTIPDALMNDIKKIFRDGISRIIIEQIPKIAESNRNKEDYLKRTYPHLNGYFRLNDIGFASQNEIIKDAQEQFFRDQREILSAQELSEKQYEKSMTLAARSLAEYILFRQNVISKMKSLDEKSLEADLHNIIAPKGSVFYDNNLSNDLYRNNVWVLDDKFMSYCTVLSEAEMSKVVDVITKGETTDNDNERPDITLFFSSNPSDEESKFDVVVVELKRLGLKAEQNSIVEFQLDTRTQRLAEYYGKRIQRMWFYGIVDFDERYMTHLINNDFNPLFSSGNIFFRSKMVYTDIAKSYGVIQNTYIMDFKALVEDANSRNATFLKILQHQFELDKKNQQCN